MPEFTLPPSPGTTRQYPYQMGTVAWGGRKLNTFVVSGIPAGESKELAALLVVNRMLADNTDLSGQAWAAFVKMPPGLPVPEWELIGSGIGTQPLPSDQALPQAIPQGVVEQLREIFFE